MGRYISCGIATQIIVYGKGCLQKNKKDLLRRIDKVFNLKYYEEGLSDNDDCICLYLKEDLFNKNFKNLLLELNDLDLFTNYFYDNIKAISSNSYNMSQKDRKKAVCDYLEKKGIKFRIKDILLLDTFFNPLQKHCIKYMVFTPKEKIIKWLIIL